MIDHRWLPPRVGVVLGRRAPEPAADPRWRGIERKPRRRNPGEER
jgi:hypothetical protein